MAYDLLHEPLVCDPLKGKPYNGVHLEYWRGRAEKAENDIQAYRKINKKVSDAYVRLRIMIPGALDTPTAPSTEQVFTVTEAALKMLIERAM